MQHTVTTFILLALRLIHFTEHHDVCKWHACIWQYSQTNSTTLVQEAIQTQSGSSCSSRWSCLPWGRDHTRCRKVALQRCCCCCGCSCCGRCCNLVSAKQALDDARRLQRPPATRHARVDVLQEIVHVPCRCDPRRVQGAALPRSHPCMRYELHSFWWELEGLQGHHKLGRLQEHHNLSY